jgi:hypothetical protein
VYTPPAFCIDIKGKGLQFAFHKHLILKEMFLADQGKHKRQDSLPKKEKREQVPALPNIVIYNIKYSTD